jgi:3(or 17)beta-hydroxysteroid dehydrogenase
MAGRVDGKVAIVTGGARGLGEAMCLRLAQEGATVVVTDINIKGATAVAERIGDAALALEHDVASEEDWVRVVDTTRQHFGGLHVLVNNAGIIRLGTVEDETLDAFRRANAVMLDGVFLGMKHGIRGIRDSGAPGSIINLSSIAAESGYSPYIGYVAAKGGVRAMTRSAAIHCQERGYPIRVNSILPGALETPMGDDLLGLIEEYVARTGEMPRLAAPKGPGTEKFYPEGQPDDARFGPGMGSPDDAAWAVVYLASDESRFVNGTELRIDNAASIQPT